MFGIRRQAVTIAATARVPRPGMSARICWR
ncbi:hypothetical protein POPTR_009G050801v4 [Populus trichocarpa]|uniref:Uncharacterized protein n=1 Tax=Populus trichocarpa TaxID=3694 RepID=A0ACC0SGJ4_POPTR|nr:hypothetical protein POPTR_009G050801v4 [Populus trichocarpa]